VAPVILTELTLAGGRFGPTAVPGTVRTHEAGLHANAVSRATGSARPGMETLKHT